MKRTFWKTALCCGLALSCSSIGQFARGSANMEGAVSADAQAGRGGSKGGKGEGRPQAGGGGARPRSGGGAKTQPSHGGNTPRFTGGGIHAPSIAGPRHAPGSGGQQPVIKRTPSFSRPNLGRSQQVHQPRSVPQRGQGRESLGGERLVLDSRAPCALATRVCWGALVIKRGRDALTTTARRSSTGPSPATRSICTTTTSISAKVRTNRPITGTKGITVTGTAIEASWVAPWRFRWRYRFWAWFGPGIRPRF